MEKKLRPGGELAARPLHFIWLLDVSGSMYDDKIQSLNYAIRNALPAMKNIAEENPNAEVLIRCITFGSEVKWHIGTAVPVADFEWTDVQEGGLTPMGKALDMVSEQLKMPPMTDRALPPILVLITDGQPTDDFKGALARFLQVPWAIKSMRLGIAIGDGDVNMDVIKQFIGNPEVEVLIARNSEQLINYIKWASTAVLQSVSSPASTPNNEKPSGNVPATAPPDDSNVSQDVVW